MSNLLITLCVGLIIGYAAQRSRFCLIGGVRDYMIVKDKYLLKGMFALLITAALLFLAWGIFLKRPGLAGLVLAAATSLFLGLTARRDEAECRSYFGAAYDAYAARVPGFLPFGP